MSKILELIGADSTGLKKQRAEKAVEALKLEKTALITNKNRKIQLLEKKLDDLLDLGPDSADSTRPVAVDFDPAKWIFEFSEAIVELEQEKLELALLEEKFKELFD